LKKIISEDLILQAEWLLLKQVKLDPSDTVIFQNKTVLYRKERHNVISGRFVRWAVAAVLLGFGFFGFLSVSKRPTADSDVAGANLKDVSKPIFSKIPVTNKTSDTLDPSASNITVEVANLPKQEVPRTKTRNDENVKSDKGSIVSLAANSVRPKRSSYRSENPDPKEAGHENSLAAQGLPEIEKLPTERGTMGLAIIAATRHQDLTDRNIILTDKNSLAKTAAFSEEPNNDRILYMNEEDVSHSKAGTFFRKIKRTVERKTKIKTGNNLRIAGFEIALN